MVLHAMEKIKSSKREMGLEGYILKDSGWGYIWVISTF